MKVKLENAVGLPEDGEGQGRLGSHEEYVNFPVDPPEEEDPLLMLVCSQSNQKRILFHTGDLPNIACAVEEKFRQMLTERVKKAKNNDL